MQCDTANVDVNKKCFQQFNPLLTASMSGYRFCVAGLLSSKFLNINVTWQDMTADTLATSNGHKKISKLIMVGIFI